MEKIDLPGENPPFQLRFDLAFELGVVDRRRKPLGDEQANSFCRQLNNHPVAHAVLELVNQQRQTYTPPRFVVYCAAVLANSATHTKLAFDGTHFEPIYDVALHGEMLRRASTSLGLGASDTAWFFPHIPKPPPPTPVWPKWAILHDSVRSLAVVTSFATARKYLAFNH